MEDILTSTRNPRVRTVAALSRRRERVARGQHLVEGPRAVAEALAAGVVVEVFVAIGRREDLVVPDGVRRTLVAGHVLAHLAEAATPQGVVAVATTPATTLEDAVAGRLVVIVDQVADPGNVGTVIRTADAAGASGVVVIAGSADPYGPKAVRAAVGSTYHLPVVVDVPLDAALAACRRAGHTIFGLDAGASRSVFDVRADEAPVTLVLGSEAHGLSAPGSLDGTLAIPLAGRAESLNVAAAAAVAVFGVARTVLDVPDAASG